MQEKKYHVRKSESRALSLPLILYACNCTQMGVSMTKISRGKLYFAVSVTVLLICLFIILTYKTYYPVLHSEKILKEYGWEIVSSDKFIKSTPVIDREFLNQTVTKLQITASAQIGLDPRHYEGETFRKYSFDLMQEGINKKLRADIWMKDNKSICAYIYHMEDNIAIQYWSPDTPYEEILKDLSAGM